MKLLLKNTRTHRFARRDGQWVSNEHEATDFKLPLEAIHFCEKHHLADTALVASENGQSYEFPLTSQEIDAM